MAKVTALWHTRNLLIYDIRAATTPLSRAPYSGLYIEVNIQVMFTPHPYTL